MTTPAPTTWVSRHAALALALVLAGCAAAAQFIEDFMYSSAEREGRVVDGKQVGDWNYRFADGTPKARGRYDNDRQVGAWTYWYENGNVEWRGEFGEGRLNGPTFFGRENGHQQAVGMFVGGLEEDQWTYSGVDGALECEGDWMAGHPELRWTYFQGDQLVAEGYRHQGEQIGPWRFYGADGSITERRLPIPDGLTIVHESWEDGVPRREGYLVNGVQQGRWVTSHPNGRRRTTGTFEDGVPSGLWLAWSASGEPIARGHLVRGAPVGVWSLWRNGVLERVTADKIDVDSDFAGTWSTQDAAASAPEASLRTWIGEAASTRFEALDLTLDPTIGPPTDAAFARATNVPVVRLRPQPWTLRETEATDFLVSRYTNGAVGAAPPRNSGYGRKPRTADGKEAAGDRALSERLLHTKLPWTRFKRTNEEVVDLDDYRGKSKVVLVVLRGMAREVCIYCVSQTEALCDSVDRFREAGCEVFIVYPGERNRLESFMTAFKETSKRMGEPPIGVLYDGNMELVDRMGITSEFALPSTFVIDERGVIEYSYVGSTIEDRPPVDDVLKAIKDM